MSPSPRRRHEHSSSELNAGTKPLPQSTAFSMQILVIQIMAFLLLSFPANEASSPYIDIAKDKGVIKFHPPSLEPLHENQVQVFLVNYTVLPVDMMMLVTTSNRDILQVIGNGSVFLPRWHPTRGVVQFTVRAKQLGTVDLRFRYTASNGQILRPYQHPFASDNYDIVVIKQTNYIDELLTYTTIAMILLSNIVMGAEIKLALMQMLTTRPAGVGVVQICQFILLPLIAFTVAKVSGLNPTNGLYIILVACCPAGGYSNMVSFVSDGEVTLSIVLTIMSTIMSMGMMPLNVFTYSHWLGHTGYENITDIKVPYGRMVIDLVKLMIPVLCGMLIRYFFPGSNRKWRQRFRVLVLLTIVLSAVTDMYTYRYTYRLLTKSVIVAAVTFRGSAFLLGALCSLISRQRASAFRTIVLEIGLQNASIVIILLRMILDEPDEDIEVILPVAVRFAAVFFALLFLAVHVCLKLRVKRYRDAVKRDLQTIEAEGSAEEDSESPLETDCNHQQLKLLEDIFVTDLQQNRLQANHTAALESPPVMRPEYRNLHGASSGSELNLNSSASSSPCEVIRNNMAKNRYRNTNMLPGGGGTTPNHVAMVELHSYRDNALQKPTIKISSV